MSDIDRALDLYRAMCAESDRLFYFKVPGPPQSWGVFPAEERDYTPFARHLRQTFDRPMDCNVAVGCIFYRPNHVRIDVDNLLGHIMDIATGVAWEDDSQVTAQFGVVEWDPDNPRTVIIIGEHDSTMPRGKNALKGCEHCGTHFKPLTPRTRFCSRKCAGLAQRGRNMRQHACEWCGEAFEAYRKKARFCSNPCKFKGLGAEKTRTQRGKCQTCGGPVSRKEYTTCWSCKYPPSP